MDYLYGNEICKVMSIWGLKYYTEFSSRHFHTQWRVEIEERDYAGLAERMTADAASSLKITWEQRGDDFYTPVKASEATLNIVCEYNFHYLSLFTSDPRKYRLSAYRCGSLFWRGFLTADLYSEKFSAPPYTVTIKATDGFSILANTDFYSYGSQVTTGSQPLATLLDSCLLRMETDLPTADWLDLYALGMDESLSPLRQTCVDMERLYTIYENPTCRDILELCLRPFGAQIFQSGGAMHIRRAIALYDQYRPSAFYNISPDFPEGYGEAETRQRKALSGSTEKLRITTDGTARLVTRKNRPVTDRMWDGSVYVTGDSSLDIVPPLRIVTVQVTGSNRDNLIAHFGFLDYKNWNDPNNLLASIPRKNSGYVKLMGNSTYSGTIISTKGMSIEQCGFTFVWEFTITAQSRVFSSSVPGSQKATFNVTYGMKVVGNDGSTYHLGSDGTWASKVQHIVSEVSTDQPQDVKIEIDGIPATGTLHFYLVETFGGNYREYYNRGQLVRVGTLNTATFQPMSIVLDTEGGFEKALSTGEVLNPANNADLNIELPIGDIPSVPNDNLIFSFYFTDSSGSPTRIWHSRGKADYNTLVGHLVHSARMFRQLPSKRLTGEVFTPLHLDLNSVIIDDRFLNAGYMINSADMDAVEDIYDCELCELPRILDRDIAEEGYHYATQQRLSFDVSGSLRCGNFIILWDGDGNLYRYDVIAKSLTCISESLVCSASDMIFPAEGGFVRVKGNDLELLSYSGELLDSAHSVYLPLWATYRSGRFWVLDNDTVRDGVRVLTMSYAVGSRPQSGRVPPRMPPASVGSYWFEGAFNECTTSENQVVLSTDSGVYVHDNRLHSDCYFSQLEGLDGWDSVTSINDDYFLCWLNGNDCTRLFRRTSITTFEQVSGFWSDFVYASDLSFSQVATVYEDISIYDIIEKKHYVTFAKELWEDDTECRGVFLIYGELYVVFTHSITKHVQGSYFDVL